MGSLPGVIGRLLGMELEEGGRECWIGAELQDIQNVLVCNLTANQSIGTPNRLALSHTA